MFNCKFLEESQRIYVLLSTVDHLCWNSKLIIYVEIASVMLLVFQHVPVLFYILSHYCRCCCCPTIIVDTLLLIIYVSLCFVDICCSCIEYFVDFPGFSSLPVPLVRLVEMSPIFWICWTVDLVCHIYAKEKKTISVVKK